MPRCEFCKTKFEAIRFNQKHCLQTDECIRDNNLKYWQKVTKPKMKKDLLTLSDYMKIAQKYFNAYIRERDKNKPCISCGAKAGTYTISAGHYVPSTSKATTFNEMNLNGQCWFNCNSKKSGNLIEYRKKLVEIYGEQKVIELELKGRENKHFTIDELKQITEEYKKKIKKM